MLGPGPLTVNSGGEIAANIGSGSIANTLTLNTGSTLGTDNKVAGEGTFSGAIAVNGNANVRLGDFYDNFSEKVNLSGNLSGAGSLTTIGPGMSGTTNAASQILTLVGNNSNFSGGFVVSTGTVATGLAANNTLGTGPITLSGGKLAASGAFGRQRFSGHHSAGGCRGFYEGYDPRLS